MTNCDFLLVTYFDMHPKRTINSTPTTAVRNGEHQEHNNILINLFAWFLMESVLLCFAVLCLGNIPSKALLDMHCISSIVNCIRVNMSLMCISYCTHR